MTTQPLSVLNRWLRGESITAIAVDTLTPRTTGLGPPIASVAETEDTLRHEVIAMLRPTHHVTLQDVADAVSHVTRVSVDAMKSASREAHITTARMVAMSLARDAGFTLVRIGAFFGSRDHGTVASACKRVKSWHNENPTIQRTISEAQAHITARTIR